MSLSEQISLTAWGQQGMWRKTRPRSQQNSPPRFPGWECIAVLFTALASYTIHRRKSHTPHRVPLDCNNTCETACGAKKKVVRLRECVYACTHICYSRKSQVGLPVAVRVHTHLVSGCEQTKHRQRKKSTSHLDLLIQMWKATTCTCWSLLLNIS